MTEDLAQIGRYEILERVGRGSMGVLYRGRDTVLDREVAVKVMHGDFAADTEARARFFREARAAARLQHRNIVTVFEFAEHEGTPYIVMEFLRGQSLAARLAKGSGVPALDAIDIAIQLSEGLEFAHSQQVVHRDVKPANIWQCADGLVKLLDFGIAKSGTGGTTTARGLMGSPAYMSPEQISGEEPDGRSDIFSLGVVLYELLCGRKPFDGDSPTAIMLKIVSEPPAPPDEAEAAVPQGIWDVVARSLEKSRDLRYASAAEFGAALERASAAMRAEADTVDDLSLGETVFRPVETLPPPAPPAITRRPPDWRLWGGIAAVVLVAALIWAVLSFSGAQNQQNVSAETSGGGQTGSPPSKDSASATGPNGTGPSPPPPAARTVSVTSEPPGAAIVVDGRRTDQRTPGTVSVEAGKPLPRVGLTLAGYQGVDRQLAAGDVDAGAIAMRLERLVQGTLEVSGEYRFAVVVDGVTKGAPAAQHLITAPAGRRTVQLLAREVYLNQTIRLEIQANRTTPLRAPALGRLDVRAPLLESCLVYVDDRQDGNPPIVISLAEGAHTVQLRCPNGATTTASGQPLTRRIQVDANLPPQVFR